MFINGLKNFSAGTNSQVALQQQYVQAVAAEVGYCPAILVAIAGAGNQPLKQGYVIPVAIDTGHAGTELVFDDQVVQQADSGGRIVWWAVTVNISHGFSSLPWLCAAGGDSTGLAKWYIVDYFAGTYSACVRKFSTSTAAGLAATGYVR